MYEPLLVSSGVAVALSGRNRNAATAMAARLRWDPLSRGGSLAIDPLGTRWSADAERWRNVALGTMDRKQVVGRDRLRYQCEYAFLAVAQGRPLIRKGTVRGFICATIHGIMARGTARSHIPKTLSRTCPRRWELGLKGPLLSRSVS